MDLNRATILGRLTQDPEVKTTSGGQSVSTIGVATNRVWSDRNGNKQERVEFHNCVLWGKLAEIAGQYLSKGRRVYLEGRLQTRDWVGQDGVKKYRTEIIVNNLIMLGGRSGGGNNNNFSQEQPKQQKQQKQQIKTIQRDKPDQSSADSGSDEEIKVEDIPF